jgi:hypothetical protein
MAKDINEKLQKLKQKREVLNARIQQIEARQNTLERKHETRRKILVGALFLDEYRKNDNMSELVEKMDKYLERDSDRKLFDLPPINTDD